MNYSAIAIATILFLSLSACGPGQLFGPTPTPTYTSTPTSTLTPTPTQTITPTVTPSATPVPNGPCDNPLLPLGNENQWTYQITSSSGVSRFSLKSLGIQQGANIVAQVEYSDQKNNFSVTKPVICESGAIVNYPLFTLNMLFSDFLDKYISAYHESGDYAPNYQPLILGNLALNWKSDYLTENETSFKIPSGEGGMYMPVNTLIELNFSLSGERESVSVPAGTFPQALKMTMDISLPVTFTPAGGGSGVGDSLHISTTQWYEPYIGLVRAQITSASLHDGFFVLPVDSKLELIEFKPGN
jgi:hypothetical protein